MSRRWGRERERGRETDRQTERDRQRETDRERQTDRDRQTDEQRERDIHTMGCQLSFPANASTSTPTVHQTFHPSSIHLNVVFDDQILGPAVLEPRQQLEIFGRNVSGKSPQVPDSVVCEEESRVRN